MSWGSQARGCFPHQAQDAGGDEAGPGACTKESHTPQATAGDPEGLKRDSLEAGSWGSWARNPWGLDQVGCGPQSQGGSGEIGVGPPAAPCGGLTGLASSKPLHRPLPGAALSWAGWASRECSRSIIQGCIPTWVFLFLFFINLFLFGCVWASSGCGVRASRCSGFSCCEARALGARAQ